MRFNLVSAAIVGATGLVCLVTPSISASFAGFALAFASTITGDLLFMVLVFLHGQTTAAHIHFQLGSAIRWFGAVNGLSERLKCSAV